MKRVQAKASILTALVSLLLSLSVLSWSQTGTSTVRGTVTDPQSRVVAGAEVTLTNIANSATRDAKTTDSGGYNFDLLAPGDYRLEVVAKGFKKQTVDNIHALIGKPSEASVQLEVGAASELVEVQASSAESLINTQDASLGNNIVSEQITQLPLEAKSVVDLLSLQPGATREGYVNGARADQSNVTLDGVDVNNAQTANSERPRVTNTLVIGAFDTDRGNITTGPVLRLNSEAVEEFRVTTANGGANQGRSSGSQVNLVTKSGGNAFHGSAFENYRTKGFTANDWFNNHTGVGRQDLIRHTFSGGIGGPIIKDKVFFFYNYEGRRDASSTSEVRTVPLSQSPDPNNSGTLGTGTIHYPYCTDSSCNTFGVGSLDWNNAGLSGTDQLDGPSGAYSVAGINPLAVAVFQDSVTRFPTNDSSVGDGFNTSGFRFNAPTPQKLNEHVAKFDFNLTKNQTAQVRLIAQQDRQTLPQWLPGSRSPLVWSHPWGLAAGHTWTLGQNWVNNFRYGFTRQAFTQGGDSNGNDIDFRFVFQPNGQTHPVSRVTPVHNITDDVSWIHGNHSVQFGTNVRIISNTRISFVNSFDFAETNPSGYGSAGDNVTQLFQDYLNNNPSLPGSGDLFIAATNTEVRDAATALIGRFSQYTANFNFKKDGTTTAFGAPSTRDFATQAYDFYLQDSWKVRPNLTLTYGLRYTLERPVYEKKGFEVRPQTPLGTYFANRQAAAANGQNDTEPIILDLSGPANHAKPLYDWDYKNFQPRVSFAWTPAGTSGKSVIRGGFALTGDYYGQALAVDFDLNNQLGFTASPTISVNTYDVTSPGVLAPLFTDFNQPIRTLPNISAPATLKFPVQAGLDYSGRIELGLNSSLVAPKNYVWNLTYERQMRGGLVLTASYVGRKAQNLLARRDVAAFNNIRDPQSGMDWYHAGTILEKQRQQAGIDTSQIASIPFFDNLFPANLSQILDNDPVVQNNCGGGVGFPPGYDPTWTPTQMFYALQSRSHPSNPDACFGGNDWTDTENLVDAALADAGLPTRFRGPQYADLSAWSTIGNSIYHAFSFSARERLHSLTLDFNYTWSHSLDDASGIQTSSGYGQAFINNPLRQRDNYGTSDFDQKHNINASAVWQLPFGKGHAFMNSGNSAADAILGGWQISSIFRWNTGIPVTGPSDDGRWATNFNVQSNASPTSRVHTCPTKPIVGDPKLFGCPNIDAVYQSFRNPYPGETGPRNTFRLPGYVSLDFGLGKTWNMPWHEGHTLQLRCDVFNATNTQHLTQTTDFTIVRDPALRGSTPPSDWGNFTQIQGQPRVMQVGARYSF